MLLNILSNYEMIVFSPISKVMHLKFLHSVLIYNIYQVQEGSFF